ncbi:MAG: hypothetical protein Q4E58_13010 [Prevotellaceae bacterium]|nr:hypothetical protein [Prevotellaceae bacterium]
MKYILLFISMVMIIGACSFQDSRRQIKNSATLYLVHDNYPKGYKTTMGTMSYTRDVLLVFCIKNKIHNTLFMPIRDKNDNDTTVVVRVTANNSVDIPCTYYLNHNSKVLFGDSLAIAIHLRSSDIEKIGINIDDKTIEDWISKTSFEFYKRENGILKHFDPDIVFTSNPNIQYKYGRLYIEYDKNGKRKEREMYEDSNDIVIYNHLRNH